MTGLLFAQETKKTVRKMFEHIRLWTILRCFSFFLSSCEFLSPETRKHSDRSLLSLTAYPTLLFLKGHRGRGEGRGEEGEERGVPSTAAAAAACHHVLGVRPQQLQGSAEAEEGLGDSTNQRGRKLPRTVPPDARQRKWPVFLFWIYSWWGGSFRECPSAHWRRVMKNSLFPTRLREDFPCVWIEPAASQGI